MEENVYIKMRLGQTGGSVAATCWRGRRIKDMTMMMMIMVIQMKCELQTSTTHDPHTKKNIYIMV
jgi:hypothetical protein